MTDGRREARRPKNPHDTNPDDCPEEEEEINTHLKAKGGG